jgi:Protein kinase domain
MVGTELGNYRILETLGEGGMGAVYKALDVNLDRLVAIRELNLELSGNPELEQRFRAEVKPLGNLNHTNLVTLYALLLEKGRPYMVTEFVEGETFEQLVRRRGPIPSDEAIPLFRQALFGIGYAHRMGLVHRDIKPGNIILNRQGVVKVVDFGLAKALSARGVAKAGARIGTPAYMSPEQFLNRGVDSRSDIYSLGVTLYEMLTGKVPFSADNDYQVMSDHVNTPPPPPTQSFAYVSKAAEQAVLKALQKNPDARFQTVEEFSASLGSAHGPVAPAPTASASPAAVVRAAPAVAATGVVAAGVVAAGAGVHAPSPAWQSFKVAASKFFATRERKMIAAALAAILVLGGALAGMRIRASRAAAAAQANAAGSAPAQNAANNNAAPPPDPNGPPPAADNGAAPAQGDAPADGVAVAPGAPGVGVAVVPGAPAVGVAVAPAQQDNGGDAGPLIVPAGTVVAVRMSDAVSSSANQAGQQFGASVDADVVVAGTVAIPAGSDASVTLINVAQAPVAPRSDVQLQLVRININGTDYRARSSVFEQQSLPRTKKGVAAAGARAAFGALGGILSHGSAGDGAVAGAASAFVVFIAPQTRIAFTLRNKITLQ